MRGIDIFVTLKSLYNFSVTSRQRNTVSSVIVHAFVSAQQICFASVLCTYLHQRYINPFYMSHQGEILQEAIKNSGISITRIVDELGITRPTIYRKFKEETIDYNFVKRVGEIINHDFSEGFTLIQQTTAPLVSSTVRNTAASVVASRVTMPPAADNDPSRQLLVLQGKYITLLEAYNELLLKMYGPK